MYDLNALTESEIKLALQRVAVWCEAIGFMFFHSLPSFQVNSVARTVATVIGVKRAVFTVNLSGTAEVLAFVSFLRRRFFYFKINLFQINEGSKRAQGGQYEIRLSFH